MNKFYSILLHFSIFSSLVILSSKGNASTQPVIKIEEQVNFGGWPNCVRLSNDKVELIITTDIGPRIIRFGFIGEQNMLFVSPADKGKTGGGTWRLYGGHRFWHAPEVSPRSYAADNGKVAYSWDGKTLKLTQDEETDNKLVKEIEITLAPDRAEVTVIHRIRNVGPWEVELAPWSISACAAGGRAIVPQEPYVDPADFLLPARPIVLWAYTKMTDPRYVWGDQFIQAKQMPAITSESKIGVLNKQQWTALYLNKALFIKTFAYYSDATYADYGCNNEIYINGDFLELESLGPLTKIKPNCTTEHTERWTLSHISELSEDENEIEHEIRPFINSFQK